MAKRQTSNLPIDISAHLAAEAEAISARIAAPSGDRIQLKGNSRIITPDGIEGPEIEVVIIDFVSTNLFYPDAYDPDSPQQPSCFAIGKEPSTLTPSTNSDNQEAATCSACPNNQFGSADNGKGKACKNTRLLAVADVNAGEDADIWVLAVSPSSLKTFDAYVKKLSSKHGTVPIAALTRIGLSQAVDYASPTFTLERMLDTQEVETFFQRREEAMQRLLTEPDTSKPDVAPAPKKRATRRK